MRTLLRSIVIGAAALSGPLAMAQYQFVLTGSVSPCQGVIYPVHIVTNQVPPLDTTIYTDANCEYSLIFNTSSTQIGGIVQTSCDGGITWSGVNFSWTALLGAANVDLTCQGGPGNCDACFTLTNPAPWVIEFSDCTSGGTAPYTYTWYFDVLGGSNQQNPTLTLPPAAATYIFSLNIMDADSCTSWAMDTIYVDSLGYFTNGLFYDCLGVLGGPNMPGTACNDNDPLTFNDTWSPGCVCQGGGALPCEADFVISQAYDSLQNPIPYSLFVYTFNNGPGLSYVWDFGDGASSTDPYPVHNYTSNGPFLLCLTVSGFGCTDTYCDTVGVDSTGTIIPMGAQGGGFTINVIGSAGGMGVDEPATAEIFAIRPNPVLDVLTVDLQATGSESARMEVVDLTGKVVRTERARLQAGANTLRMDVSTLETGTYLFRLTGPNGTITQRFVHGR